MYQLWYVGGGVVVWWWCGGMVVVWWYGGGMVVWLWYGGAVVHIWIHQPQQIAISKVHLVAHALFNLVYICTRVYTLL